MQDKTFDLVLIFFVLSIFVENACAQIILKGRHPCSDSLYLVYPEEGTYSDQLYLEAVADYFSADTTFCFFDIAGAVEIPIHVEYLPSSKISIVVEKDRQCRFSLDFQIVKFDFIDFDPRDLYNLYENVLADSLRVNTYRGHPSMPWGAPNVVLKAIKPSNSNWNYLENVECPMIINPDLNFTSWTSPRAFVDEKGVIALYLYGAPDTRLYLYEGGFAPYLLRVVFDDDRTDKLSIHLLPGIFIRKYGYDVGRCFEKAFF